MENSPSDRSIQSRFTRSCCPIGLHEDGIRQAREALKIYRQLSDIPGQAHSWQRLAWGLHDDGQLDAADEAASQAINLLTDKDDQLPVCECHCVLSNINCSKGETGEAIQHFETTPGIASSFGWHYELFWDRHTLSELFFR